MSDCSIDSRCVPSRCRYASGERVACAALFELRDGKIAAFDGVQAWDA